MIYTYNMPCDHAGGTFWYHPHHMGSTTVQVAAGATGALIVDYSAAEQLPEWLMEMEELVLVIQHIDLTVVKNFGNGLDNLFQTEGLFVC